MVLFIEIAFVLLIISLIYRRYIKPFRQAMRSAKETMAQRDRPHGRPVQDRPFHDDPEPSARQSAINNNPRKPLDKSNVQDAEFEDLS